MYIYKDSSKIEICFFIFIQILQHVQEQIILFHISKTHNFFKYQSNYKVTPNFPQLCLLQKKFQFFPQKQERNNNIKNIKNNKLILKYCKIRQISKISNNQEIINQKKMYSNLCNKLCRNGQNCYYYQRGICWFWHPQSFTQQVSVFSISSMNSNQDDSVQINSIDLHHSQLDNPNFHDADYFQQMLNLSSRLRMYERQRQMLDQPIVLQQQKTIKLGNNQVKLLKIVSKLTSIKSWYFQNSLHYQYYPQCQYKQCSICINNFQQNQTISLLYCKHAYHIGCIQKWLESSQNCPLCRKDFKQHQQFKCLDGYIPIKKIRGQVSFSLYGSEGQSQIDMGDLGVQYQDNSYDHDTYEINESYYDSYHVNNSYDDSQHNSYHLDLDQSYQLDNQPFGSYN